MKSEPDTFSIDALAAKPESTDGWEGVRACSCVLLFGVFFGVQTPLSLAMAGS
jgi:hypothetical protein